MRDSVVDQVSRTGHAERLGDLDLLASLGVRAVRYPVIWERTMPVAGGPEDWAWADRRLHRLQALGLRPVVGLVHHGQGPVGTDLTQPAFASGLAAYAGRVAERYPWIEDYTPVNEPLTTARFSTLYGHWYPHARDDERFVRAVLVQCQGIREAMRAIRRVTPRARLVQTEDFCEVSSTPKLGYQAEFENQRRFLTLDLLTGRVDSRHPLFEFLVEHGAPVSALESFSRDPCPPDIIGLDYYVTSDRFLDDRFELYPPAMHGGNGRDAYADVEAVRVRREGIMGHRRALQALSDRYSLPLAITEVSLAGPPEQQIRWLLEAWSAASDLLSAGVDVRAVTVWAAFGSYDWDSLLTQHQNHYEAGVFDVRDGEPKPTPLADVCRSLASHGAVTASVAGEATAWWRSDDRLLYAAPPPSRRIRA